MATINVGDKVLTPEGAKATVKGITRIHTGKVGRPAHMARVQERQGSKFGPVKEYPSAILRKAV